MAGPDAGREGAGPGDPRSRATSLILFVLVAGRLAYHATYLGEVPFALGTFSDGAIYEAAARDIVEHPPLGTKPFYLQGAYAYLLALGMAIRPWATFGLLVQLVVAGLALWLAHRSAIRLWGPIAGRMVTLLLLASPALAFYENKFLSASLGFSVNVLVFAALVRLLEDPRSSTKALFVGAASGLAILARPNMILALPLTGIAVIVLRGGWRSAWPGLASFALGVVLGVAPMAGRNLAVTGHPDIQPIHGGGTSFYIGNNPRARGLWNDADLLSARLGTEREELAAELGVAAELDEREQARAIGEELYRRGFAWIRAEPVDWFALELRKLWRLVGNQELAQDYDWRGEQELIPWAHRLALPFGALLALALLGLGVLRSRSAKDQALAWWLGGQVVAIAAANLIFFTSAQHRLPLVLPLAIVAGPALAALLERRSIGRGWWIAAGLVMVQAFVPRLDRAGPSAIHYYNLAIVQDETGDPEAALSSLDRAIELRPDHPALRGARAHLRVRLGDFDGAAADLDLVADTAPRWVVERARLDRATIAFERSRR